jgi:hypothetical protein
MIWLLAHPLPSHHVRKLDRRLTGRLRKWGNFNGKEGEEVGEELSHTTARKPGPL